jgi:hypothetical protein
MSEDRDVLGNLPNKRPARRSAKRAGREAEPAEPAKAGAVKPPTRAAKRPVKPARKPRPAASAKAGATRMPEDERASTPPSGWAQEPAGEREGGGIDLVGAARGVILAGPRLGQAILRRLR